MPCKKRLKLFDMKESARKKHNPSTFQKRSDFMYLLLTYLKLQTVLEVFSHIHICMHFLFQEESKRRRRKKSGGRSESAFTTAATIELTIVKHNCIHKVIGTEDKNCLKVTGIFCDRYVKQVNTIRQAGAFLI